MDTVEEASNEFQDWDLLQSNSDSEVNPAISVNTFDVIDSGGLIQVNYFSLDPPNRRFVEELDDNKSVQSDDPSWVDPGLDENPTRYLHKESGEFWSDSSTERSEDRKFSYFEERNEMASPVNMNNEVSYEGIGEMIEKEGEKIEDLGKSYLDSGGPELGFVKFNDSAEKSEETTGIERNMNSNNDSEVLGEEITESEMIGNETEVIDDSGNKKSDELEKGGVVWWKMPMEFLRYCVFRMSPVWSVSVAAAVMGFVILGRRLYRMNKKARGLQIKVAVDEKKMVSQVMSRAARLNEAFSVVKRVPMIRPSMPALGSTTPWPAMTLR